MWERKSFIYYKERRGKSLENNEKELSWIYVVKCKMSRRCDTICHDASSRFLKQRLRFFLSLLLLLFIWSFFLQQSTFGWEEKCIKFHVRHNCIINRRKKKKKRGKGKGQDDEVECTFFFTREHTAKKSIKFQILFA